MPLVAASSGASGSALPPLVCPAGGPIGSVDLRVSSPRGGSDALPLRTINRLEEGDILLYRPILRSSSEERKGEVTVVLVPVNAKATGEKLHIMDPKPAGKPQQWNVPWRTSLVAFVYGPSGLSVAKVKDFLSRDDTLVAQLADYAEKTEQTEALIAALASPNSSSAAMQAALQGFSSQYGLSVQLDKTAPANQQAMTLFRTLNPAIASYDPIVAQGSSGFSQTAGLATSVATLFFGSPVGLAAGGTSMLLELRSIAFPHAEFRSSFSKALPDDGLGLCGRRDAVPAHTKVAYLWATRVPNIGPPQVAFDKANSLPPGVKSPLPVTSTEADWKFIDRAHNWMLEPADGKPIPVKAIKLGDTKTLELDLDRTIKPGAYRLAASWDWEHFEAKGVIEIRPLADFASARLIAASQDLLVAKTGKVPVTLDDADFEFVTKVEMQKENDEFATTAALPFVLPQGLRQGMQGHMDVQVNTIDLDPGSYKLLISQVDGKSHAMPLRVLPAPPRIDNFPVVLNQGAADANFVLKGQGLNLLKRLEIPKGTAQLGPASATANERPVTLHVDSGIDAGTSLALKAYIQDRNEPLTFADAVRVVGPRPSVAEAQLSQPSDQDVQLDPGELPGGMYLSAILRIEHLQSNSTVRLGCDQPESPSQLLHLGERSGPLSLQQLAPGEVFLSFDTSLWTSGCMLGIKVANGSEGESETYKLGLIVRVPKIRQFDIVPAADAKDKPQAHIVGLNLETIEKVGWNSSDGDPVERLPLPVVGGGSFQQLDSPIPPVPDEKAVLYVWLRGESKARATRLKP